jgi:D-tyrosyl-tRNA(Tyr) deacylase
MRALLQRVSKAEVRVGDEIVGAIGRGLLVLLGVGKEDGPREAAFLADKTVGLRIFEDPEGKMNLSVEQIGGEVLVVSQFTLYADCRKGRRPSFTDAAPPLQADQLYQAFAEALKARGLKVATGNFGEKMKVELTNDGPVTILLDSDSN